MEILQTILIIASMPAGLLLIYFMGVGEGLRASLRLGRTTGRFRWVWQLAVFVAALYLIRLYP